MSRGLNKVMIIGNLGRDPEMRYTPSGRPVTTFSVAANRQYTNAEGEKQTDTEWFNVVAWGKLAEICNQYLAKGRKVYVEGRLQSRQWEDAQGTRHTSVEIVANEMIMLGSRPSEDHTDDEAPEEDEFPF